MDGRTDGWTDRQTDGQTDGRTDGLTYGHVLFNEVLLPLSFLVATKRLFQFKNACPAHDQTANQRAQILKTDQSQ